MGLFARSGGVDWLIVGLGNPGPKYDGTRHNVGYKALDALAKERGCEISRARFHGLTGRCEIAGQRCVLLKPLTFMNASGEAAGDALRYLKLPASRMLVIFDDVSLEPGAVRVRRKGSDGGHNGIKSLILHCGEDFPRVKIGVGAKPHPDADLAAHVLGRFGAEQRADIDRAVARALEAVPLILAGDIDEAMNRVN